jgi:hypothetical protein
MVGLGTPGRTALTRTLDDASHIEHVLFARLNTNSLRRVLPQFSDFSEEFLDSSTGGRLIATHRQVAFVDRAVVWLHIAP